MTNVSVHPNREPNRTQLKERKPWDSYYSARLACSFKFRVYTWDRAVKTYWYRTREGTDQKRSTSLKVQNLLSANTRTWYHSGAESIKYGWVKVCSSGKLEQNNEEHFTELEVDLVWIKIHNVLLEFFFLDFQNLKFFMEFHHKRATKHLFCHILLYVILYRPRYSPRNTEHSPEYRMNY